MGTASNIAEEAMTTWNLQDAKNRFSAVVREALKGP